MRPSVVSLRSSIAPGAQHPPSAETLAGLNQKKKEAEAVDALQRASALFLQRLEGLADDCEAMADAGAGTLRSLLFCRSKTYFVWDCACVRSTWRSSRAVAADVSNPKLVSYVFLKFLPPFVRVSDTGVNLVAARGGLATCMEGAADMETTDADASSPLPTGERLVRVPIDELQQAEQK